MAKNVFLESPLDAVLADPPSLPPVVASDLPSVSDAVEKPAVSGSGRGAKGKLPPPDLLPVFNQIATETDVPVNVLMAMADQESGYNSKAVGPETKWGKARGMMQYLDSTAKGRNIDATDAVQSIRAAAEDIGARLKKGYSMDDAVKEHFAGPDRKQWGKKTAVYGDEVLARAGAIGDQLIALEGGGAVDPNKDEPGRYIPLTDDQASNTLSTKMSREAYEENLRRTNPAAPKALLDTAMQQYDVDAAKQAKATAAAPAQRFETLKSPEATFNAKMDQRLQSVGAGGIAPALPGMQDGKAAPKAPAFDEDAAARETQLSAIGSQLGRSLQAGSYDMAGAGAKLLDAINPFTISQADAATIFKSDPAALKKFQEESAGLVLSRFAEKMTKKGESTMEKRSDRAKRDYDSLEYATTDTDNAAYASPVRVMSDAVRSLPSAVAMAVSVYFTRGAAAQAERSALASGMSQEAAKQAGIQAGAKTMALVSAGTEGGVGYAQQANQTANDIDKMTASQLAKSPKYQALLRDGYTPATARAQLKADASEESGVFAGVVDGAINAVAGQFMGKVISEGGSFIPRVLKGAVAESGTEAVQSGGEQIGQNVAMRNNVNPDQQLLEGTGEAVVGGAAVGGLMGGVMAGAGGGQSEQQAQAQQQAPAAAPVPVPAAPAPKPAPMSTALEATATKNQGIEVVGDDGKTYNVTAGPGGVQLTEAAPSGPMTASLEETAKVAAPVQEPNASTVPPETVVSQQQTGLQPAPDNDSVLEPATAAKVTETEVTDTDGVVHTRETEPETLVTDLATMTEPQLRERLKAMGTQAKASGGWNKEMVKQRRIVEAEINKRAKGVPNVDVPEVAVPDPVRTTASPNTESGAVSDVQSGTAGAVPVPHGAGESTSAVKDIAAGKWFGSQEKAQAFVEKRGLSETHNIQQTGKVRFEVKPIPTAIENAANEAATSPVNDLPEPTQAQKDAGNFKVGRVKLHGMDMSIEFPAGTVRAAGREPLAHPYGYIRRTEAADGDHVDAYFGPRADDETLPVYVVDQVDQDGKYDEAKVMVGFDSQDAALAGYNANYPAGWNGAGAVTEMSPEQFKAWTADKDATKRPAGKLKKPKTAKKTAKTATQTAESATEDAISSTETANKSTEPAVTETAGTAPEHATVGVDDRELGEIVKEFNEAQASMIEGGEDNVTNIFAKPKKSEIVRLGDKAKVFVKDVGWMTPAQARARIEEWKQHAQAQGKDKTIRQANSQKVVLSLFDLSGQWSQPWEDAGYQVYRFDIQADPVTGDVNNFSTDFFGDWFGDFDGMDIHAILAACPCTDFAVSGARHFAAKDEDGRTVASVNLVHQTLRTIEYFKPAIWSLENPVGRIEKLGGLPPWRLSFDPNQVGDPYTKKTLIWGRFNADLPIAPVEPTEGSKMHKLYGGKSMKTKNARSVTPEGFAYSFFMANNAHDNAGMAVANKYDRLDAELINRAMQSGVTEEEIDNAVEDFYYMDLDDDAANEAIQNLIPAAPAAETDAAPAEDVAETALTPEDMDVSDYDNLSPEEQAAIDAMAGDFATMTEGDIDDFEDYAGQLAADEVAATGSRVKPDEPVKGNDGIAENSEEKTPKVKKAASGGSTPEITDVGEKILGAKKDLWVSYQKAMTDELPADAKDITMSKNWPEPDYDAMIAAGSDVRALAAVKAMRDEVPAKPKVPYKLTRWAGQVKSLHSFSRDILNGTHDIDFVLAEMKKGRLDAIAKRIELYAAVGYPAFKQAKGYAIDEGNYTVFMGKEYPNGINKFDLTLNNRTLTYHDTREEAVDALRMRLDAAPEATGRTVKLDIYSVTRSGEIIIGKKVGSRKYIDLKGGFKTATEARNYLKENEADLLKLLAELKELRPERRSVNDPRKGKDYRMGEDISAEKFASTFGFRGVQFGNYVEQKRRVVDVNNAYDALLDLADLIGIPERAISLNGELGLAFGARGSGGKNAFAAHYEPKQVVINLMKANGAGSLGHEWFHALDNYFSRVRGAADDFVTNKPRVSMKQTPERKMIADDSIRPELLDAFKGVIDAINKTALPTRSAQRDSTRTEDYWSTTIEMAARSFESYLIDKAVARGESNDYLANIIDEKVHAVMNEVTGKNEAYAYPTEAEKPVINAAFDKLFETMQSRETEKGTALYSVKAGTPAAEFGPILTEYTNKPAEAIKRLMADKTGEAVGAIVREDIGDISLVYGTDNYGLKHIAQRRGADFFKRLPNLLKNGEIYTKPNQTGRVFIGDAANEAVIRLDWNTEAKTWLVSAYEKYPTSATARPIANPGTAGTPKSQRATIVMQPSGAAVEGIDVPTLDATLRSGPLGEVIGQMIDAGQIVLHSSPRRLPKELRGPLGIQAVTGTDGTIHMVSNALGENAQGVLLHEIYHNGVENLIGSEQWANLQGRLGTLYRTSKQSNNAFWKLAQQRVEEGRALGGISTKYEVEEFGAYAIEEYENAPQTLRKWIDDLIGAVKAYLAKRFGKQFGAVTPAQLRALSVAALRYGEFAPDADSTQDPRYSVKGKTPTGLTPVDQNRFERLQAQIQDNMNRVKQVQGRIETVTGQPVPEWSDYYGAETNRPGRIATRLEVGKDQLIAPLMKSLAKQKYQPSDLSELLHAQHAEERNKRVADINPDFPDGGSGMTTADAKALLTKYAAPEYDGLRKLADDARTIAKQTLAMKLAYGLIDQESHDALANAYKYYVPLKGDGEYGPKVKRAMGHDSRDEQILQNVARDFDQAIVTGEKNLARQSLLSMVVQNPDPDLWSIGIPPKGRYVAGQVYNIVHRGQTVGSFTSRSQVDAFLEAKGNQAGQYQVLNSNGDQVAEFTKQLQDNEVMVYVAGEPVRIQIFDEALALQLRPLNQGQMHWVLETMRGMNRWFSKIYTGYNPAFILKNTARDAMTGTINILGNDGVVAAAKAWANYPMAIKTLTQWAATGKVPAGKTGRLFDEYRQNGGKVGASYMSDLEEQGKTLTRIYEDAYGATGYLAKGSVGKAAKIASRKAIGGLAHVVEVANQATENGLRLALYMALRDSGTSASKAAQAAKLVTVDFDRKGTSTGALGAIYLFLNPAIQGTANAGRTLFHGKHKYQAWAAVSLLPLLAAYATSAGYDDDKDRWLGRAWDIRTKNFILNIGSHELRIPLSQEYAPFYATGMAIAEGIRGEGAMKSSARLVSSFIGAYFPLNVYSADSKDKGLDVVSGVVPTAIKPFYEAAINRNSFGSQIKPENDFTKDRTDNLKMNRGTKNSVFDTVSQQIADAGVMMGANKYENGITKISPEVLKHYWRTYTGGLGTFITDTMGVARMSAEDTKQIESGDVPFVKDFWKPLDVKPIRSRFYELSDEVKAAATEFKEAKKAGDVDAIDDFFRDEQKAELLSLQKLVTGTAKAAGQLRDEGVDINADKTLGGADKRARLKTLEKEEEELLRNAIGAFK